MRRVLATVAYFALLVLGCGLSFGGWKVFRFCEFIYTDSYYTDRLMHVPEGMPHTWRDSVGYWSGLALWTLPSLILAVPGLILLFIVLRGIFSRPVMVDTHNQEAEQVMDVNRP
jgi:hypothetical protein